MTVEITRVEVRLLTPAAEGVLATWYLNCRIYCDLEQVWNTNQNFCKSISFFTKTKVEATMFNKDGVDVSTIHDLTYIDKYLNM